MPARTRARHVLMGLQSDAFGAPVPPAELVKTLWELLGLTALNERGEHVGTVDQAWLDQTFKTVGEVVAESVKAGVECGSFALQLVPNAFEVGVRRGRGD